MSSSTQAVARALQPGGHSQPATQATRVEQSRAMAEVQAMVVVARQAPRDETKALAKMEQSCRMMAVASHAFFNFDRGDGKITGETIHLAVELARVWGNITYGITELERHDERGQSEMIAYAWDLETNSRSATSFIVPHKRDKKGGAALLTSMRDIYENNANMGARRLREMIFRVLPPYLTERAKEICYETLEKGEGDVPMAVRIANCLKWYAEIGVSRERIEAKLGMPADQMTAADVVALGITFQSIRRKEIDAAEAFPMTGAVVVGAALAEQPQTAAETVAQSLKTEPAGDAVSPRASETAAELGQSSPVPEPAAVEPIPEVAEMTVPMMPNGKTPNWPAYSGALQEAAMAAPSLEWIEAFRKANRTGLNSLFRGNQDEYKTLLNVINTRKSELTGADRS